MKKSYYISLLIISAIGNPSYASLSPVGLAAKLAAISTQSSSPTDSETKSQAEDYRIVLNSPRLLKDYTQSFIANSNPCEENPFIRATGITNIEEYMNGNLCLTVEKETIAHTTASEEVTHTIDGATRRTDIFYPSIRSEDTKCIIYKYQEPSAIAEWEVRDKRRDTIVKAVCNYKGTHLAMEILSRESGKRPINTFVLAVRDGQKWVEQSVDHPLNEQVYRSFYFNKEGNRLLLVPMLDESVYVLEKDKDSWKTKFELKHKEGVDAAIIYEDKVISAEDMQLYEWILEREPKEEAEIIPIPEEETTPEEASNSKKRKSPDTGTDDREDEKSKKLCTTPEAGT